MSQFIIRRVMYSIVTLFILSGTIFLIVRLTGDPVALMAEASARPEDLERVRHQWGLDRSWPVQYVTFMQNALQGELGKSFNYRLPVSELYFQRLPNSLTLGLAATLISLLIGIPAGIISAVKVNTAWDNVAKGVALLGLSIPGFWLGLVLILVFSVWLRWLPTSGSGDWRHVVMPALALGWYFAASMLRLTRSSMLEVLGSEYIKLARLKGLPDFVVIAMHAFKNALIPVFTLAGVNMVVMVNAAVIIEVLTDNKNRTVGELRHLLEKHAGNLASTNAVAWMFAKKGYIVIEKAKADEEKLLAAVLDAGADDLQDDDDNWEVLSAPEAFTAVNDAVKGLGIEPASAQVSMIPQSYVKLEGKVAQQMLKLMEALDDQDDVQHVWSNFDISEKEIEASLA